MHLSTSLFVFFAVIFNILIIEASDFEDSKEHPESFNVWDNWPGCKDVFLDVPIEGNCR